MPEPRETHTAIDARRNARGGGGDVHELALLLAQHQRLDAPGGRCSCGHETALGDLTSRHVADAVIAAGWEHPDDEVLVEGSWFARPDLPVILGNFMRRCDEYGREAKALAATVQRVRELHRPWYEIDGVRHDHCVAVGNDDVPADHICRTGGWDACLPDYEEHYVLACVECRQNTEDGEHGSPLWPCDTIRALAPSDPATDTGGDAT